MRYDVGMTTEKGTAMTSKQTRTTIPNHVPYWLRKKYDLTVEHAKGDRVQFAGAYSDQSPIGTVIAVTRKKELTIREQSDLSSAPYECESWVGQQIILIRWANGKEGGGSPDGGLKWQPAYKFKKVQA
jgi:hypothetical protein